MTTCPPMAKTTKHRKEGYRRYLDLNISASDSLCACASCLHPEACIYAMSSPLAPFSPLLSFAWLQPW